MKKLLLILCMMCGTATMATAGFEDTNFSKYKFTFFHARYYNAENSFYVAPLVYTITGDNTVSVSGADLNAAEVVIPEKVENNGKTYKVTSIHGYAFQWCSELETLTIPASVDYIYTSTSREKTVYSSGPFVGCKKLKTINNLAMKAQGFWNNDAKGRNMFCDIAKGVTINTPAGSDYTAWAKYVDGLQLHVKTDAAGYATYYIDKAVKLNEGAEAAILEKNGNEAKYSKLYDETIPSKTAVIIKGKANSDIVLTTVTPTQEAEETITGNLLIGTLEAKTAQANGQFYVLGNSASKTGEAAFEPVSAGNTIKNEAYLPSDVANNYTNLKRQAKTATGISNIEKAKADTDYTDLLGRKTKQPSKGIYIQNGKKEYKK